MTYEEWNIDRSKEELYELLDNLEIGYAVYNHKAVYTIEESQRLSIPGYHCKNLFLKNRKGNKHYLVIVQEERSIDLKVLSEKLGSTALSFASEERLYKYLGLKPGAVTPFGIINDKEKEIIVVIHEELEGKENICFHPNANDATISVSYDDLMKFINWNGNEHILIK